MDHYDMNAMPAWLVPFSANFFRCVAGIIGFTLLLYMREGFLPLREALHDRKGMGVAVATTIFGPFVGVGFSLMAVQYHYSAILLAVPSEDHVEGCLGCIDLCFRREPFLPWLKIDKRRYSEFDKSSNTRLYPTAQNR